MTLGKETTRASWVTRRVGELATAIQYGYTAKANATLSGPKYLRITDIQDDAVDWPQVPSCSIDDDDVQKYRLQPGDLVFARTGATVGKSYLIRPGVPESVFASYLIRIRLKDEADPRYVAYFFQSPSYWWQINENQAGIGQLDASRELDVLTRQSPSRQRRLSIRDSRIHNYVYKLLLYQ